MLNLSAEKVDFVIATTDTKLIYTESGGVTVYIDVQKEKDMTVQNYSSIKIHFITVAEVKCTTLNFFEHHYNDFVLEETNLDTLFYQITNSSILEERRKIFDPHNDLQLKHYLLIGYDSYTEIIASKYKYEYLK